MSCETFAEGASPLHRADPRAKLLAAASFTAVVAVLESFPPMLGALGVALLLVSAAALPPRKLLARLLAVNVFIFFLWLLLPFTARQGELIALPGPDASREGLRLAAAITLKANAIVLALLALVSTSTINALGKAMERLRVPEKLVHLLLFTYRYIDVIGQEHRRLATAMKARGFCPGLSRRALAGYGWLVGMLFVRSYDRSLRVRQAMLCRGFHHRFYTLSEQTWRPADSLLLAVVLAAALFLGGLEWLKIAS